MSTIESYELPRSSPVYVCPDKDIECGERPQAWCNSCPKRVVNQAEFDKQLWGAITGWHRAADASENCGQWAKKIDARVRELMEAHADEALAARDRGEGSRAHFCIAPACGERCHHCNHAISPEDVLKFAKRYAWLREHACTPMAKITVGIWGVDGNSHAGVDGRTPQAIDAAIDAGINATKGARHD